MKKRKRIIVSILVLLVALITTGGIVYADELNGFLDWEGSDELATVQAVIGELVSDIIILDSNLQSIESQLDTWILEDEITEVELDLNGDGIITTAEKIATLKAFSSSSAGGQIALLLEIAILEAELVEINDSLDLIIINEGITVVGNETANEKVILIESHIADLDAEIIWLHSQLNLANAEAEAFEEDICTALNDLPSGLRGNYETWCPIP